MNTLTEGNGQNQALESSSVKVKFLILPLCFPLIFFVHICFYLSLCVLICLFKLRFSLCLFLSMLGC